LEFYIVLGENVGRVLRVAQPLSELENKLASSELALLFPKITSKNGVCQRIEI